MWATVQNGSRSTVRNIMTPQTQLNNHNYRVLSHHSRAPYIPDDRDSDGAFQELANHIDHINLDQDNHAFTVNLANNSGSFIPNDQEIISKVKSRNTLLIAVEILEGTFDDVSYKEYADYLGNKSNSSVLYHFVDLLKPFPFSLLSVLYKLASSVYLIAESQNIDRILEEVSRQWIKKYPHTVWEDNYKLCHIVLFSLLILNSDLHNDQTKGNNHHKFSCDEFIRNTFAALEPELALSPDDTRFNDIKSQVSHELVSYYEALKHTALPVLKIQSNSIKSTTQSPKHSSIDARNKKFIPRKRSNTNYSSSSTSSSSITPSPMVGRQFSMENNRSVYSSKSRLSLNDNREYTYAATDRKYHQNVALPQLYKKETFDTKLIQSRCPMWVLESILYISEDSYDSLRLLSRRSSHYSESLKKGNNRRISSSVLSLDDGLISGNKEVNNSSNGIVMSSSLSPTPLKPSSSSSSPFFLKWLKKKTNKKRIMGIHSSSSSSSRYSRNSVAFLESGTRWIPIRMRIDEGRVFVFKMGDDNNNTNNINDLNDDYDQLKMNPYVECCMFNLIECTAEILQDNVIVGGSGITSQGHKFRSNFNIHYPPTFDNNMAMLFQFQTNDRRKAEYNVDCINFWAARLSSIPDAQFEIVSNDEYGWSNKLLLHGVVPSILNGIRISEWKPLLTMDMLLINDDIDEPIPNDDTLEDRLLGLTKFLDKLSETIDQHNDLKPKIIAVWDGSRQFDKVMNNWNNKYLFLHQQYQKQTVYSNILREVYDRYICVQD